MLATALVSFGTRQSAITTYSIKWHATWDLISGRTSLLAGCHNLSLSTRRQTKPHSSHLARPVRLYALREPIRQGRSEMNRAMRVVQCGE
jgi:hypothetical protein